MIFSGNTRDYQEVTDGKIVDKGEEKEKKAIHRNQLNLPYDGSGS